MIFNHSLTVVQYNNSHSFYTINKLPTTHLLQIHLIDLKQILNTSITNHDKDEFKSKILKINMSL